MTAIAHLRAATEAIRAIHPHDALNEYAELLTEIGRVVGALHEVTWAASGASEALHAIRAAIVRARARTTRGFGMGRIGEGGKGGV